MTSDFADEHANCCAIVIAPVFKIPKFHFVIVGYLSVNSYICLLIQYRSCQTKKTYHYRCDQIQMLRSRITTALFMLVKMGVNTSISVPLGYPPSIQDGCWVRLSLLTFFQYDHIENASEV